MPKGEYDYDALMGPEEAAAKRAEDNQRVPVHAPVAYNSNLDHWYLANGEPVDAATMARELELKYHALGKHAGEVTIPIGIAKKLVPIAIEKMLQAEGEAARAERAMRAGAQ